MALAGIVISICFLQGMYRSASYVVFVNYEEILQQIETTAEQHCERRQQWFFSGYDCDSLAMEPVTRFMQTAIPFFAERGSLNLEIRTKSTQVRSLLDADPIPNCVVAMSFTPDVISRQLEHKVPSVGKRVAALQKLQRRGWQVGLRFDPVIYAENYLCQYRQLFDDIFAQLDADAIHSVSLGAFRLPRGYFRSLVKLYPREKLFASGQLQDDSVVSYRPELEQQMMASIRKLLGEYLHEEKLFTCDWQG